MKELFEYEYFFERQIRQAKLDIFEPWIIQTGVLPWRLIWESSTDLTLACNPEMENPKWAVEILFRLRLFGEERKLLKEFEAEHNFKQDPATGCPPWRAEVEDVPYNTVKFIHFEVLIIDFSGLRTHVDKSYFFTQPNPKSNCILSTGEHKFYVNLDFLSIFSTYFNELRLRHSDSLDPSLQIEIDLHRNSPAAFAQALAIVFYNKKNIITNENVHAISSVSYLFSLETVLKECELYLVNKPIKDKTHSLELLYLSNLYGFYEVETSVKKYLDNTEYSPHIELLVSTDPVGLPFLATKASYKCNKLNKSFIMTVLHQWLFKYKQAEDGVLSVTVSPNFLNKRCINWKVETGIRIQIGEQIVKKRLTFNTTNFKQHIELPNVQFIDGITTMDTFIQVFSAQGVRAFTALEDNMTFKSKDKTSTVQLKLNNGKLYANIQYLAFYSQWFLEQIKTLSSLPKEDGLPVLEVDAKREDFLLLLRVLYPSKIDSYAEKFKIPRIFIYCERRYVATNTDELQFALDFGLKSAVVEIRPVTKPKNCRKRFQSRFPVGVDKTFLDRLSTDRRQRAYLISLSHRNTARM